MYISQGDVREDQHTSYISFSVGPRYIPETCKSDELAWIGMILPILEEFDHIIASFFGLV